MFIMETPAFKWPLWLEMVLVRTHLTEVVGELCAHVKSALGSGSLLRPLSSSEFTQGIPRVGGGQAVVLSSPAVGLCKDQDTGRCCS